MRRKPTGCYCGPTVYCHLCLAVLDVLDVRVAELEAAVVEAEKNADDWVLDAASLRARVAVLEVELVEARANHYFPLKARVAELEAERNDLLVAVATMVREWGIDVNDMRPSDEGRDSVGRAIAAALRGGKGE